MGEMRCIAIGVSYAPPLDYLPGAVNGAKAFGTWAQDVAKIPTPQVLTDEETPVEIDDVKEAFAAIFRGKPKIARLIVYFAGHGLGRGVAEEFWLLSKWKKSLRAVAPLLLRDRLENYGVDQLTVVSDACRSGSNNPSAGRLAPEPILDEGPFDSRPPDEDWWRAASPFRAAYMVRGNAAAPSRCLFSGLMIEALTGAHADAFDPERNCVTNFKLDEFLKREVPRLAGQYGVTLNPQNTPSLRPPDNVYLAARPAVPPGLVPWPSATEAAAMSVETGPPSEPQAWAAGRAGIDAAPAPPVPLRESVADLIRVDRDAEADAKRAAEQVRDRLLVDYAQAQGVPTHFETGAGVHVSGALVDRLTLGHAAELDGDTARAHADFGVAIRTIGNNHLVAPGPLLIRFAAGFWGGAAAIPGRIANFAVEDGGVASLIYRETDANLLKSRDAERAVAMLRSGEFAGPPSYDLAARLRDAKESDPMRAVLAAYLYDALGDVENIWRMAFFLNLVNVPLPYDLALLGRCKVVGRDRGVLTVKVPEAKPRQALSPEENARPFTFNSTPVVVGIKVAGSFPWLRQGWWRLRSESRSPLVAHGLPALRAHVLDAPFTTLDDAGGAKLSKIIEGA